MPGVGGGQTPQKNVRARTGLPRGGRTQEVVGGRPAAKTAANDADLQARTSRALTPPATVPSGWPGVPRPGYNTPANGFEGMAERTIATVLKTVRASKPSWVRIPLPPPLTSGLGLALTGRSDLCYICLAPP